jgi:AraC-like DNA-binding protein
VQELKKGENYFVEGWGLHFHPDLIRKFNLGKEIDNYSFFSYNVNEALHISVREKETLSKLGNIITEEYHKDIDKHTQILITSNIELLLNYCTRFYERQFYSRSNLNRDYIAKFEKLIKDYYNQHLAKEFGVPSIKYFADKLNLSTNYLSDLLRNETGKSSREHIHLFIVERAKNVLLNSSESIGQIAHELGFEHPSHFSKLFKVKEGISPAEYRKVNY